MKAETTLAGDILAAQERARYDAAVKKLLADKRILAWILKGCVGEFFDRAVNEIAEQYIEGEPQVAEASVFPDEADLPPKITGTGVEDVTMSEGTVTFDIRFHAAVPGGAGKIGLIINLEAQNDFYPGYPLIKRGIYYCSRMISSQYGTVFTKSHYEKIKKVYSVWICADPPRDRRNTITQYCWTEKSLVGTVKEKADSYDLMTVVMICLGSPQEADEKSVLRLLDVLLSAEAGAEEKQAVLERDFDIPMTEALGRRVTEMCNLSKGVENRGIEKGIEKGILASVRNLMDTMKLTAEQAMDALKIPESEKAKYASKL